MKRGLRSMMSWCIPVLLAEAGGQEVQGQPGLHNKFKTSVSYMVRVYIYKQTNKIAEKKKRKK